MKRLYLFLVYLVFAIVSMSAQEGMSVKSFIEIPSDLDARVTYPVQGLNAKKCALVKIVTTEGDFTFDNGVLGVAKAIHKPELSEWWVYLPEKTIKLKVMHPVYGQLTDSEDGYFYFPNHLKSATCYRMVLTTQRKVVTYEPAKVKTGYLIINSTPEGGQVYLTENGVENYVGTTPFQKKLPYGTYNYRIKKSLYYDEVGVAEVDNIRVVQEIPLRPAFGSLKVTTTPLGATVTIDGVNASFTTPCEIPNIASGNYYVNIVKSQYSAHRQMFTIEDGKSTSLDVALDARFAPVKIGTLPGAKVVINGEQRGFGGFSGNLDEGIYDIEVSLAQHRSVSRQIEVVANQPQTLTINPTPIYGSLDIETTPMYADITINGKNYGNTPTTIENLLIGDYDVVLSKDGCATETRRVTIAENTLSTIKATLVQGREKTIRSDAQGDEAYIDGTKEGRGVQEGVTLVENDCNGLLVGINANTAAPGISFGYRLGKNVGVPGLILGLEAGLLMSEDWGLVKMGKFNEETGIFEETLAWRAGLFIAKEFNFARNFVFTPQIAGGIIAGAEDWTTSEVKAAYDSYYVEAALKIGFMASRSVQIFAEAGYSYNLLSDNFAISNLIVNDNFVKPQALRLGLGCNIYF